MITGIGFQGPIILPLTSNNIGIREDANPTGIRPLLAFGIGGLCRAWTQLRAGQHIDAITRRADVPARRLSTRGTGRRRRCCRCHILPSRLGILVRNGEARASDREWRKVRSPGDDRGPPIPSLQYGGPGDEPRPRHRGQSADQRPGTLCAWPGDRSFIPRCSIPGDRARGYHSGQVGGLCGRSGLESSVPIVAAARFMSQGCRAIVRNFRVVSRPWEIVRHFFPQWYIAGSAGRMKC